MERNFSDIPIAALTVQQLIDVIRDCEGGICNDRSLPSVASTMPGNGSREFVYGIAGLAGLFGCSKSTAARIKSSGKIDAAITQIGRKIIVDAGLALELAGKKKGGRK